MQIKGGMLTEMTEKVRNFEKEKREDKDRNREIQEKEVDR